jgi:hypothetical protein
MEEVRRALHVPGPSADIQELRKVRQTSYFFSIS